MDTKVCIKCGEEKSLDWFPINHGKSSNVCRKCRNLQTYENRKKRLLSEVDFRKCCKCGETKPIDDFYKNQIKCKKCQNEYFSERNKTKERKEYMKRYHSTDEYKELRKEYLKSDKYKETIQKYYKSERYKELRSINEKSEKRIAYKMAYRRSEKCKEYQRRRRATEEDKQYHLEYDRSETQKKKRRTYYQEVRKVFYNTDIGKEYCRKISAKSNLKKELGCIPPEELVELKVLTIKINNFIKQNQNHE